MSRFSPKKSGGSPSRRRRKKKNIKNLSLEEIDEEVRMIGEHKIKLEVKLKELEELENFIEAKKVHEKLKELNLLEGIYLERKVKLYQEKEKMAINERHAEEKEQFTLFWTEKSQEYETRSKEITEATVSRQKREEKEIFESIKSELMTKKIKYSRKILEMKKQIKLLVQRKKYVEAEEIQKKIKPIELAEMEKHHEQQDQTLKSKMELLRKRHQAELDALRQRIEQGRNELRVQRENDLRRLKSKQSNLTNAVDLNHRKHFSEYKTAIQKQTQVLENHYEKNVVDFQDKFNKMGITARTPKSSYAYALKRPGTKGARTPRRRGKRGRRSGRTTPRSGRKRRTPKKMIYDYDNFEDYQRSRKMK